jgi:glycosyltransferase involved in cell wall biosynthesis
MFVGGSHLTVRVAFCITDIDDGGAERHLAELVTRLPRDRFEPAIVVLSRLPRPPADRLRQLVADHRVSTTFLNGRSIWSAPVVWQRLRRWLDDFRPELLQCFLAHANVLGAYAGHWSGVPHIVTGIQVAEQRFGWHLALQRRTDRFVQKHVCVSQAVADFAVGTMRLPREKLAVITNGIEVDRFVDAVPVPVARLGVAPTRRFLLFAGRLDPQKRPDWLLERMAAVFQRLPNHDLVIAGEGPMRDMLRKLCVDRCISERVHFVGWQSDMPGLLAAADLLVLTSRWEGMPNILLEAMAAARPIVTTDVHGARELFEEIAQGQITPAEDAEAFVEAVVRIAGNTELAHQLGAANRRHVAANFTMGRMIAAYIALYNSLIRT